MGAPEAAACGCYNEHMLENFPSAKRCRRCGKVKGLGFFPKDATKPDGRWHSCRACNRAYWATRGKQQAAIRKARKEFNREMRSGLSGLRQYGRRSPSEQFSCLPPSLRPVAQQILSRSLDRARKPLTQQRVAARIACAASNARRVGDHSLGRRLRAFKGLRRREQRQREQEARLSELRARNQGKSRSGSVLGDL